MAWMRYTGIHSFPHFFLNRNENTRKYYSVNKWVIHELRKTPTFDYDIAVVQVKNPIQFNQRTKPIAFSSNAVPFRANVQMTGWGGINVRNIEWTIFRFYNWDYNYQTQRFRWHTQNRTRVTSGIICRRSILQLCPIRNAIITIQRWRTIIFARLKKPARDHAV